MKWKDINKDYKFKDDSIVTQRHQTQLYDCYELQYEVNGEIKTLTASKDHLLKINISKWPRKAKQEVRQWCNGLIPLTEDIEINIIGYLSDVHKVLVKKYIIGEIDKSAFNNVEDISTDNYECYIFTFKDNSFKEVFVKRIPLTYDNQKIDNNNFWIPIDGLYYLFSKYGELTI